MQKTQAWALSFDTDWVPQFIMDIVFEMLSTYNIPATFFCTSAYIFPQSPLFEQAVHPNYLPNSSHGKTENESLNFVKTLYPHAIGHRSHCYYWHTMLVSPLQEQGITYDSSLLLPFQDHLAVHSYYDLFRIPVWCGDNILMNMFPHSYNFNPPNMDKPGLKVLNFHPIHIYLNSKSLTEVRANLRGIDLPHATEADLKKHRHSGGGIEKVFEDTLKKLSAKQTFKLSDLLP